MLPLIFLLLIIGITYLIIRMLCRDAIQAATLAKKASDKMGPVSWWIGLIILLACVGAWLYLDKVVYR